MSRNKNTVFGHNNNDEAFFIKEKLRIEELTNNGNLSQARKRVDRLCKKFKNNPEAWYISSVVCGQQADYQQAIVSCKCTISLAPHMPISYLNLGIALRMNGQLKESLKALLKSVELQPDLLAAYRELGVVSHALGNYLDAVKYITVTTEHFPNDPMTWISLGNIHEQNANYVLAEKCYRKAFEVDDKSVAACVNLGNMLKAQNKISKAEECYKDFLLHSPKSIDLIYNLALLYQSESRLEEAESYYRKAIDVDFLHINSNNNLGLVLLLQNKLDSARDVFLALIRLQQDNFDARRNLALVYRELNELVLAEEQLSYILKREPDNIAARQDRSLVLLQKGDFDRGWKEYEWRLRSDINYSSYLPFPIWDGTGAANKSILLYPEQGVGDEVMFSSCVTDLGKIANDVTLVCDERMKPIFERSFPDVKIVGQTKEENISTDPKSFIEKFPDIDVQLSIASLPMYFRNKPSQYESAATGYLISDSQAVEKWQARFNELGDGLKVGVSWRGGHVSNTKIKRSIGLDRWGEIFKLPNVRFVNLQYGDCTSELEDVSKLFGIRVNDWDDSNPLLDLDDFSAKIKALDLVVSIDNSTVHLAGALGVETWLLQPFSSDWRWLLYQTGSYWYSSIKQYRQDVTGNWEDVLGSVANDLSAFSLKK